MAKRYVALALADSMFGPAVRGIGRRPITAAEARLYLQNEVETAVNPSHTATIDALRRRYGLALPVPPTPPKVVLNSIGDEVLVIGIRGLPRLTDRHEYTDEEVGRATFEFTLYYVAAIETVT